MKEKNSPSVSSLWNKSNWFKLLIVSLFPFFLIFMGALYIVELQDVVNGKDNKIDGGHVSVQCGKNYENEFRACERQRDEIIKQKDECVESKNAVVKPQEGLDQNESEIELSEKEEVQEETSEQYQVVDAQDMIDSFDANQLSAEKEYKDKNIELKARVTNISEDILGTPFLSLEPTIVNDFYMGTSIKCSFEDLDDLINLTNEQIITVQGKVRDQSMGVIIIKDCKVKS